MLLRVTAEGFEALDHDGHRLATLSARELAAIAVMAVAKTHAAAFAEQHQRGGLLALDESTSPHWCDDSPPPD